MRRSVCVSLTCHLLMGSVLLIRGFYIQLVLEHLLTLPLCVTDCLPYSRSRPLCIPDFVLSSWIVNKSPSVNEPRPCLFRCASSDPGSVAGESTRAILNLMDSRALTSPASCLYRCTISGQSQLCLTQATALRSQRF